VNAAAVHINDAAPGTSPSPPAPNHDNKPELNPDTAPRAGTAVITGAEDTAEDTAGAAATTGPPTRPPPPTSTDDAADDWDEINAEPLAAEDDAGEDVADDGAGASAAAIGADAPGLTPADDPPLRRATLSGRPDTGGATCPPRPPRAPTRPDDTPADSAPDSAPGSAISPRSEVGSGEEPRDPDPERTDPERAPLRGIESDDAPESEVPVDPADPVVSANATGTGTTAAPTPRATANAPTRPTYRA
jgi:hypothetical protein